MSYDSNIYTSKNIYLPKELAKKTEERAKSLYMNFSSYIRHLIVSDITKTDNSESRNTKFGNN